MKARILLAGLAVLVPASMLAQTTAVTVHTFEAYLSPSKETPAVTSKSHGKALVEVVATRDTSTTGAIVSAIVDFKIESNFEQAEEATGLHIHRAAEGVAGPVVVNTGLTTANLAAGPNTWFWQAQVNSTAGIAAVTALIANPSGYYVNLHTKNNPSGHIRGQLMPGEPHTALSSLSTRTATLETLLRQVIFRLGLN